MSRALRGAPIVLCACLACAYDWTVPPGNAGTGGDGGDATTTTTTTTTSTAGDGGAGGAATGCAAEVDCASCTTCVFAASGFTPTQCAAYQTCLLACPGCLGTCASQFPEGAAVRGLLDAQCTALCGGMPTCL